MVCDKIIYGGQVLLTLYHGGLPAPVSRRITQKIGRYNVVFEETECQSEEVTIPEDWFMKEEGLVSQDSFMNPYGSAACAYVEHYCYAAKPKRLFHVSESKSEYSLALQAKEFLQIEEFVKKYTGFPISKNPMHYGDVFVYKNYPRCYHAKQAEGIVVENLPANALVIVRFQKNSMIVATKIVQTTAPAGEIEILAGVPWDHHDLEIYVNDQAVFCCRDVSYMRRFHLSLSMVGRPTKVRLDKIAESYQISHDGAAQTMNIGYDPDEIEEVFGRSNQTIRKQLNAERPDPVCTFICPDERKKALELIGRTMQDASDSLWIFDSYFTDLHHVAETIDWLRIIAQCRAKEKHIVFFVKGKQNALDPAGLADKMREDHELERLMRNGSKLNIHLYQTSKPIHDRFVLTESAGTISGLAVGTSFHSLNDHHYCIFRLSDHTSRIIWNELRSWLLKDQNVVSEQEV